jgi:DNA excision repair protein ERCC-1
MDGGREQQAPPESQPGKNLIKIPSYQEVFGTGASSSSSKPPSYNPPVATSAAAAASSSSSSSGSFSQAFSFLKSSEFYSPPPPPPQPITTPRYLYCPPSLPLLSTCDAGLDSDVPGLLAQADSS